MKYYLLFLILNLVIIFAYADFDDKKVRIEKMQNHLRKIKGILRNLDTSDEDDDDDDSTDDEDSSNEDDNPQGLNTTQPDTPTTTPTLPTAPKRTGNKNAAVQLIDLNSFSAPREADRIYFRAFFIYINVTPARWVIFNIAVRIYSSLRYLDENYENKTVNCTIDPEDELKTQGANIRYNCETPKAKNTEVANISVINATFSDPELKDEEINYSEEAALATNTLVNKTEIVNKIYKLDSCQITPYSNYFIISGEMNNLEDEAFRKNFGISENVILKINDNSTDPTTRYNATCTAKEKGNRIYEYRCIPDEGAKGVIDLSPIKKPNGYGLSLNIEKGSDYLNYAKDNSTNVNYNKGVAIYRKSSSGLSGGAIAGIVIACVVALIIASLVAIMMRKSAAAAAPFQSQTQTPSIVGLRSVDNNYTQ